MLFEIERDDGVVVYQVALDYITLNDSFLFEYRFFNSTQEIKVWQVNDDLVRQGDPVILKPAESDSDFKEKLNNDAQNILTKFIDNMNAGEDFFSLAIGESEHLCDICTKYDECTLPFKKEKEDPDGEKES